MGARMLWVFGWAVPRRVSNALRYFSAHCCAWKQTVSAGHLAPSLRAWAAFAGTARRRRTPRSLIWPRWGLPGRASRPLSLGEGSDARGDGSEARGGPQDAGRSGRRGREGAERISQKTSPRMFGRFSGFWRRRKRQEVTRCRPWTPLRNPGRMLSVPAAMVAGRGRCWACGSSVVSIQIARSLPFLAETPFIGISRFFPVKGKVCLTAR